MRTFLLIASFVILGAIPSSAFTLPGPNAHRGSDSDGHKQHCLNDREARDIIERYSGNFEVLDEASVNRTFTEDFTYESDSTSFFLRLDPGTQTIGSRGALIAALRADQAIGPAFTVTVNLYTHTCDTIIFRYRLFGGRVQPSAVGGIDWLFVDLKSRKIRSSQAEFNSAAILYNFGALGPPNATSCLNGACEGEGRLVQGCGSRRKS